MIGGHAQGWMGAKCVRLLAGRRRLPVASAEFASVIVGLLRELGHGG